MMSSSNDRKEQEEIDVFKETLRRARQKGSEARRNADRISGEIEHYERPDIVIRTSDNRLVGMELFRVDSLIKKGEKAESAAAELESYGKKERERIIQQHGVDAPIDVIAGLVGDQVSKGVYLESNACHDHLVRSLKKRLFDEKMGHIPKIDDYRTNLDIIREGDETVELGFLIELHANFSKLFLHTSHGARKLNPGETPLFSELFDMLEKAAQDVDWIMLAFCPANGSDMTNAAVVCCRNGMFRKSAERQKLLKTEYLGLGKSRPMLPQFGPGDTKAVIEGSNATLKFERTFEVPDEREMTINAFEESARAFNLKKAGVAFTTTVPVQMIYEMLYDRITRTRGAVTASKVLQLCREIPESERRARVDEFGRKWGLEKPDMDTLFM